MKKRTDYLNALPYPYNEQAIENARIYFSNNKKLLDTRFNYKMDNDGIYTILYQSFEFNGSKEGQAYWIAISSQIFNKIIIVGEQNNSTYSPYHL